MHAAYRFYPGIGCSSRYSREVRLAFDMRDLPAGSVDNHRVVLERVPPGESRTIGPDSCWYSKKKPCRPPCNDVQSGIGDAFQQEVCVADRHQPIVAAVDDQRTPAAPSVSGDGVLLLGFAAGCKVD